MDQHDWHLNPEHLPKRLDLELSEETYNKLERMSSLTGVSIEELAFNDATQPDA